MTILKNQSLAEEITQNTFFKAMTAKKPFGQRSGELTWLCSIAKRLAIDECRKNKKVTELDEASETAQKKDLTEEVEDKETALQIHLILHELQEPYKEVFQLRIFGELSFTDSCSSYDESEEAGKEHSGWRSCIAADHFLCGQNERRRAVFITGNSHHLWPVAAFVPVCDQRNLIAAGTVR